MGKPNFLFLFLGLLLITSMVSAFEFDNIKKIDWKSGDFDLGTKVIPENNLWLKYKPIQIDNVFGLGKKLFAVALTEHTEVCEGENCYSKGSFYTSGDEPVYTKMEFLTLQKDDSWLPQAVRSWSFSYLGDIDNYEYVCTPTKEISINGTAIQDCSNVKTGTHKGIIRLNAGDKLPEGTYDFELISKKKPSRTVDWIMTSNGVKLSEMAVWGSIIGGDDAEVILNSPADSSTAYSANTLFSGSFNITGGANGVNMSLWNDVGGWSLKNNTNVGLGLSPSAYWNMNTDGSDSVGNSNLENNGVNFDGSKGDFEVSENDFMINSSLEAIANFHNMSLNMWIKPETLITYMRLYSMGRTDNDRFQIRTAAGTETKLCIFDEIAHENSEDCESGTSLSNGVKAMVTTVFNTETNNISIYVDGNYLFSAASTYEIFNLTTPNFNLGSDESNTSNFDGTIDGVPLYNRVLTPTEITTLYTSGSGISPVGGSSATQTWNYTIPAGDTIWNVQACDSDGDCGFATANYTVSLDATAPTVDILYPTGTITSFTNGGNVSLNYTISDTNLDTCWYAYGGTNTTTPCTSNSSFLYQSGTNNITLWANDTVGTEASDTTTWSFNITENSQTYPTTAIESSIQTYTANLTYDSTIFSIITGTLTLNGTEYTGTRTGTDSSAIFTTVATMPSIAAETNFTAYWTIDLTDTIGTTVYNLTSHDVTVVIINLSLCGSPLTVPFWNFTMLNESNEAEINTTFEATFSVKSTGSTTANEFSYSDTAGDKSGYDFCISPGTESYIVSTAIKLTKTGYVDKFYNYQEVIVTNATRTDNLYMLTSGDSTSYIIHVVDVSAANIEDAEVKVQRYYPGNGDWLTTEILTTNYVGEAVGHILSEDADYRFLVYQEGISTFNSSATKIVCAIAPCTVTLVIPIDIPSGYEPTGNLASTLTFSSTTNIFTYTYSDTSRDFSGARFYVHRVFPTNAIIITACNTTKLTSSGVMTCNINEQVNGTYKAEGYITRTGDEFLDRTVTGNLGTKIYNGMGIDGVLWAFFVFIAIIMMGLYRPSIAIVFGIIGFITLSLLQIINIGVLSLWAIVAVGIILLWRIGKE